jgi:hypothetical protein
MATTMPGDLQFGETTLAFTGVTSVTAGRVARKSGAAASATAEALARDAEAGVVVAGLSMFEQGYYDRLGFGTGSYEHIVSFDPATLTVPYGDRLPKRVDSEQVEAIHRARLGRMRSFGSVNLRCREITEIAMSESKNGFGLGFFEGDEPTHLLWASSRGENGPYEIAFMAYRSWAEFVELLGVLRRLGDQVRLVKMVEPPGFQMQSVLSRPFRSQMSSRGGRYENSIHAEAFWQLRILDLSHFVSALRFPECEPVSFVLELEDPIAAHLPERNGWQGIGGRYVVTLGPDSAATAESENGASLGSEAYSEEESEKLPLLRADVGALTRVLTGVTSAATVAATERFQAPAALLQRLERILRLQRPHVDWLF